jgi:multidrug efflux pump subunit AcrB
MWMTRVSIKHPVFATMVMVGLMVLGLFSYRGLGVESMPNIEIPAVWIETQYPGASPEQVENDVTRPVEEVANTVGGIKTIRSSSWEGHAGIGIEFQLTTDMDRAVQDLRDKIGGRARQLPARGQGPSSSGARKARTPQPVLLVSLTSHERSLRDLSMLAEQVIVKRMQAWPAWARCASTASKARQVLVDIRPTSCAA